VAGVKRPNGEVLDMKERGKYRESEEMVVFPRHSGDRCESGGEAMEDDAVEGNQNCSPEFLPWAGCVDHGRLLEPGKKR
jgi:hypothetical protein